MNTTELAYNIIEQLDEEQLKGFIALFKDIYPAQNKEREKKEAFQTLEGLRRHIDIDEQDELDEWRKEKYKTK